MRDIPCKACTDRGASEFSVGSQPVEKLSVVKNESSEGSFSQPLAKGQVAKHFNTEGQPTLSTASSFGSGSL